MGAQIKKKIIRDPQKNKKIIPDLGFDYNIGRGAAVKCGINSLGKYIMMLTYHRC